MDLKTLEMPNLQPIIREQVRSYQELGDTSNAKLTLANEFTANTNNIGINVNIKQPNIQLNYKSPSVYANYMNNVGFNHSDNEAHKKDKKDKKKRRENKRKTKKKTTDKTVDKTDDEEMDEYTDQFNVNVTNVDIMRVKSPKKNEGAFGSGHNNAIDIGSSSDLKIKGGLMAPSKQTISDHSSQD